MRNRLVVLCLMLGTVVPASAQVSISIGFPNMSIGINLPLYPELEPIPGYPVYYAPRLDSNYFFYDGMYWVYQRDSWYASSWYNGPWARVDPEAVPLFVLRIPVRYYRQPPVYFRDWQLDAPPRWGNFWGYGWAQRRSGWDRWDHHSAPAPAPLPIYQRQYSGDRYPRWEQQQRLHEQSYRYQPQDPVVRQQYQGQRVQRAPEPPQRGTPGAQPERHSAPQGDQRHNPYLPQAPEQRRAPTALPAQALQEREKNLQRPAPNQALPQRNGPPAQRQSQPRQQGAIQHQPTERGAHDQEPAPQGKEAPRTSEKEQRHGQERGRDRDDERGQNQQR